MLKKAIFILLNNRFINRFLILIGRDGFIMKFRNNWSLAKLDPKKSLQENVGFSHHEDIQLVINRLHKNIQDIILHNGITTGKVLDIGCGTGLYLNDFDKSRFELFGTDLNKSFLEEAQKLIPGGKFYNHDFLSLHLEPNFNVILCISVVEYIPPSKLKPFLNKVYNKLATNGLFILQYPHAICAADVQYADLSYVRYSPDVIERSLPDGFTIISHSHFTDNRIIHDYDRNAYDLHMENSFRNGYLLVAKRQG